MYRNLTNRQTNPKQGKATVKMSRAVMLSPSLSIRVFPRSANGQGSSIGLGSPEQNSVKRNVCPILRVSLGAGYPLRITGISVLFSLV